jgi:hypothetical protein
LQNGGESQIVLRGKSLRVFAGLRRNVIVRYLGTTIVKDALGGYYTDVPFFEVLN